MTLKNWSTVSATLPKSKHFENTAFSAPTGRLRKGEPVRKIFVTYDKANHRACLNLSPADQDLFSLHDKRVIYPVPNKWGLRGWTYVELANVRKTVLREALKAALGIVTRPAGRSMPDYGAV